MSAQLEASPLLAYAGIDDRPIRAKSKRRRRPPKAKRTARRRKGPKLDKDARKAEKVNRAAVEAAPLLASAGLVEQTTPEVERERRLAAVTAGWWETQRRNQHEAQTLALIPSAREPTGACDRCGGELRDGRARALVAMRGPSCRSCNAPVGPGGMALDMDACIARRGMSSRR